MAERTTDELNISESDIIKDVLEMENGSYPKQDEVTTTQASRMLGVSRHRAYDVLQKLLDKGLLTRRVVIGERGGTPFAYKPVTSWGDIRDKLKESRHASETMGREEYR